MSKLNIANIPAALRERPQWVTWKAIQKADAKKPTKMPCDAKTGKAADSTDPTTWATFEEACAALAKRHHTGIGYVFSNDDPYTGIDLDDCCDPDGSLADWAQEIVSTMDTYSEISPSGTGVKLWVEGDIPSSVKTETIEMYSTTRFFTVTGLKLPGAASTIRSVNDELTALYDKVKPKREPQPEYAAALPTATADADYIRRWCLAGLAGEQRKMLDAGDGRRHSRRYDSAFALGGLVPSGGLTEGEIFDALAVNFGPDRRGAEKTIRDGIRKGQQFPRRIPPPRQTSPQIASWPADPLDGLDNLDADELRHRLRTVTTERDYWKSRAGYLEGLEAWRSWNVNLNKIPGEHAAPATKVVANVLWTEMKSWAEHGKSGPQPIHMPEIAQKAGMSTDSVGKAIKELDALGSVKRTTERDPRTGHLRVLVEPAAFATPAVWQPPAPRNHGGRRLHKPTRPAPICATCPPSAPVLETITTTAEYQCACGQPLGEPRQRPQVDVWWRPDPNKPGWVGEVAAVTPDPNPQLAQVKKDCSLTNPQVAGWGPASSSGRAMDEKEPSKQDNPAPARLVQPWRYRQQPAEHQRLEALQAQPEHDDYHDRLRL